MPLRNSASSGVKPTVVFITCNPLNYRKRWLFYQKFWMECKAAVFVLWASFSSYAVRFTKTYTNANPLETLETLDHRGRKQL